MLKCYYIYNLCVKEVEEILSMLIRDTVYDPVILLMGIHLKKSKTLIWKDICTTMFIAVLFTIAKIWKQPKCVSVD